MNIYLNMLYEGMKSKGHTVEIWKPEARFYKFPSPPFFKKWLGYIDQFILFPMTIKSKLKTTHNTLFVFIDNALGPWVPHVKDMPHVIHCHDFLAHNSAFGLFPENKVSWTGKKYQGYIKRGLMKGKNFISVSQKTNDDLHGFLGKRANVSALVYNGLNNRFKPLDYIDLREEIGNKLNINLNKGYILHIGGNLWYKNRKGVLEIYIEWKKSNNSDLPLLLVGENLNHEAIELIENSGFGKDIIIVGNADDALIHELYAGASLFIFPSLEEGFGWPIAEAMACGCLVMTTNKAPMTEVGGQAAFYISRRPFKGELVADWAKQSALFMNEVLKLPESEKKQKSASGFENIKRFNLDLNLNRMEAIYKEILMAESI